VHFTFLGSAGALPARDRDTTSIVFVGDGDAVLIDCGGSPMQKLLRAGVTRDALRRVIITHMHTDHAYGLPSLVETLYLLGRRAPLRLACREEHEQPLRTLLGVFRQLERPGIFPIVWELVPAREGFALPALGSFAVSSSPNAHGSMPNVAVRLILAHIDVAHHGELDAHRDEARAHFAGEVEVAQELVPYPL